MRAVIDRFEGDTAICVTESGAVFSLPAQTLPDTAREGLHIVRTDDGPWRVDSEATEQGREALRKRMDRLWK